MRSHLLISEMPTRLLHGTETIALCGTIVRNPVSEMFGEVGVRGMPEFHPLRDCRKCFDKAAALGTDSTFYVYVLREGPDVESEAA